MPGCKRSGSGSGRGGQTSGTPVTGRVPLPLRRFHCHKICIYSSQAPPGQQFIGIPWDIVNYSCAYDSLLTIILSVYTECQQNWKTVISQQSATLRDLGLLFDQVLCQNSRRTIVHARDQFRIKLGRENADLGPKGSNPTDIIVLPEALLQ